MIYCCAIPEGGRATRAVIFGALFVAGCSTAAAQDVYSFEPAAVPGVGTTFRLVRQNRESNSTGALGLDRTVVEPTRWRRQRIEATVEVLESGEGAPPELRIRIDRASLTEGEGGENRDHGIALAGTTLLARGRPGGFEFALADGRPLEPAARDFLQHGLHSLGSVAPLRRACLPSRPVAVGDLWRVPVEPFVESIGLTVPGVVLERSSATAHLLRVGDRDGRRIGVLGFSAEIVPRVVARTPVSEGVIEYTGRVETPLDGTVPYGRSEYALTMHLETLFRVDGRTVSAARWTEASGSEEVLPGGR